MKNKFCFLLTLLCTLAFATPQINIIIDDMGNNVHWDSGVLALPGSVTCSILPYRNDSIRSAQTCTAENKEVIVHVPMEPNRRLPLGPGGLTTALSPLELQEAFLADINSIPGRIGFNNHMGSLLTRDQAAMTTVMQTAKPLNIFYVDSLTDARSVSGDTARAEKIPTLSRDVFLDDVRTTAAIAHQFQELIRIAKIKGYAIAIGHPYPVTTAYLAEALPGLEKQGVVLVPLSQLIAEHGEPKAAS